MYPLVIYHTSHTESCSESTSLLAFIIFVTMCFYIPLYGLSRNATRVTKIGAFVAILSVISLIYFL